jgi:hypothetical protein
MQRHLSVTKQSVSAVAAAAIAVAATVATAVAAAAAAAAAVSVVLTWSWCRGYCSGIGDQKVGHSRAGVSQHSGIVSSSSASWRVSVLQQRA